ncbi:MAG: TRAP transporter substrate-binding protein DctP [Candidatus Aminicenantes bacterium]|jgi:TRAP-type C4-dicarboxylate transport system substrate-binding protein
MKIKRIILLFILSVLILPGSAYSMTIRIGSVARTGSQWDQTLKKLQKEWKEITRGEVKIQVKNGGVMGSEYDMIQEMRSRELEGAAFFNRGLPRICPEVYMFTVPLIIASEAEHDYVFTQMKPTFEKKIAANGFKVVTWSLSGWLKLFSKHPVFYPGDLQKHNLSLTTWNPDIEEGWRDLGFHVVPTDFKDLKMALQSGMVDAFFLSPLEANDGGYFTLAPNMCTQTSGPEYWCIVLTAETWTNIPDQYKKQMKETAEKLSKELYKNILELEKKAIEEMEEQDLLVNKLPADALEKWQNVVGKGLDKLTEKDSLLKKAFERMIKYLKEYREKKPQRP